MIILDNSMFPEQFELLVCDSRLWRFICTTRAREVCHHLSEGEEQQERWEDQRQMEEY